MFGLWQTVGSKDGSAGFWASVGAGCRQLSGADGLGGTTSLSPVLAGLKGSRAVGASLTVHGKVSSIEVCDCLKEDAASFSFVVEGRV